MNNGALQLSEEDLLSVILSDLKRCVREYATAATESACQQTRQMFTDLLNSTLKMQGELFTVMSQNNMYEAPSEAPQKEITKQIQSYMSTQQKTQSWLQQGVQQGVLQGIQSGMQSGMQGFQSNNQQSSMH